MRADRISRYLLELDEGDDAPSVPGSRRLSSLAEAQVQGFESGRAAAEALLAAKLEEQATVHREQLASARKLWTEQESARLAELFANGIRDLETRLANAASRILRPFLLDELRRRAIEDLAASLAALRVEDKGAVIKVSGARDL